jgi:hypothetical protein
MKLWMVILGSSLLITGCVTQQTAPLVKRPVKEINATKEYADAPRAPKKDIELKEVEDTNFSSEYMYPETKSKKKKPATVETTAVPTTPTPSVSSMSKGECIAMIGQEKFNKYTQMLGNEASAIKRCQMLKAL